MNRSYSLGRAEIPVVLKEGKSTHSPFFSCKTLPNKDGLTQVAIVASKKVFKNAILRNKAKRRAREAFRKSLSDVSKLNYVFLLKHTILDADFKDLTKAFSFKI